WFNLAWCDPAWAESDPRLAELKRKDRNFSEDDKGPLFEAQMEIMQQVIPKYRELADRGQAELTFSPYYHPILPLLCHVDSARTGKGGRWQGSSETRTVPTSSGSTTSACRRSMLRRT